ncbi:conserved hypothetical protein [Perkinsus marinus ATCC 50983]|uniref:Folate receptor-like domain-containing protein n=1 Tax=Perkinsus marinus (strain ATCC 50983 / TXsc) TaxID=423536 RepID=C5L2Q1_PERM5|nr:conserved hypothetical protein [Perkinsus marinus ATCC 50983]EER08966.1 conserved hypothetical protein [Perkinsus marinus ATCC 50983]|eukprot:XP_002777150.1 conserved hypothetical protein [Perkinsus marinus ATCC 50983]
MRPLRSSLVVVASVVTSVVVEAGNCSIAAARYGLMDFPAISVDRSKSSEPLSFCAEYSGNTCCGLRDDLRIRSRYVNLVGRGMGKEDGVSQECADMLRKVACLPCDGYLASQSKLPSICGSFCDSWFDSCRGDFFAVVGSGNQLDLCDPKSTLICARLDEIVADSAELCERSGLGQITEEEEESECFDGVPNPNHRTSEVVWKSENRYEEAIYEWVYKYLKVIVLAALGLFLVVAKMYARGLSSIRRGDGRRDNTRDARKEFLDRWQRQHDAKTD